MGAAGGGNGGYDPTEFARGGVRSAVSALVPSQQTEEEVDPTGFALNAKHSTFALEVILGRSDGTRLTLAGQHHGVQYGAIVGFPFMDARGTIIRLLCFGSRWSEEAGQWVEGNYELTITGQRLRPIYARIVAGIRSLVSVTGEVTDPMKPQVDEIRLEKVKVERDDE